MGRRQSFDELPSTQQRAVAEARAGIVPDSWFLAGRQTDGRGRGDHRWASPSGNLYLSYVIDEPPRAPELMPLAVGVALAERLRTDFRVVARVKWPNDLVVPRPGQPAGKLAGILTDRVQAPDGSGRLVVGVGLNVAAERAEFPPEVGDQIALLAELCSAPPSLAAVEASTVAALQDAAAELRAPGGPTRVVTRCSDALYGRGRPVTLDGRPAGVLEGLFDDGSARIAEPTGLRAVRSGELRVVEAIG